ncbi:hypothetical protein [Streptomyces sp. RPT161]|uniref:hypothetical protein n=1 Tax=Streptomyces sp. RPT161 TaxID=3015993 RepID=UPI0022B91221|nr:hypothetical protein [Streptomyces sp. RPT161]
MGIWIDAFIAPVESTLLSVECFGSLLVDLARERIVRTPWTLVAGDLCVNAELLWGGVVGRARFDNLPSRHAAPLGRAAEWWEDDPPPWGPSREQARVLAGGDAILDVLSALRAAPYGAEDIAVAFSSLDFTNPATLDHYWAEDGRTVLACYALATSQVRPLDFNSTGEPGGPTHPVRTCVVNTFKLGDRSPCLAIERVVSRHFASVLVYGHRYG